MGLLLGLLAAVAWGVADFLARGPSQRLGALRAQFGVQVFGAVVLGVPLALTGALAPEHILTAGGLQVALAAVVVLAAALLFYRALAIGYVSIVSPVAAGFAAVTAALAILAGDRPGAVALAGIVATLAGVVLVASVPGLHLPPGTRPWRAPGLVEALVAALLFGVGFWFYAQPTAELGGPSVVWIGRVVSALALAGLAPFVRQPLGAIKAADWRALLPIGLLDALATGAYAVGLSGEEPAVVAVLGSLFSAVTVLLAAAFLRERLRPWQWLGVALILVGVALASAPEVGGAP